MTSVFDEAGNHVACTVIELGPCVVTQVKTEDTDGYTSLQLGFGEKKEKHTSKPLKGHFEKAKKGEGFSLEKVKEMGLFEGY